jgi:hypothetical protein
MDIASFSNRFEVRKEGIWVELLCNVNAKNWGTHDFLDFLHKILVVWHSKYESWHEARHKRPNIGMYHSPITLMRPYLELKSSKYFLNVVKIVQLPCLMIITKPLYSKPLLQCDLEKFQICMFT